MCDLSPAVTPVHFPGRQECLPHTVPIRWILVAQLIMWQSSLSGDAAQLHSVAPTPFSSSWPLDSA